MKDRQGGCAATTAPDAVARPTVLAEDISYVQGAYRSYEHLDLRVEAGTAHALVGSGDVAARDALLSCAGLVRPTAGSLTVCGVDAVADGRRLRPLVGLGLFPGVNDLSAGQTVAEALAHELRLRRAPADEDAVLAGLAAWLLATLADAPVEGLPAADRARLGAACAAAGAPRLMVVPDIESGASPDEAARTLGLLADCAHRTRAAVLFATSSLGLARAADTWTAVDMAASEAMAASDQEAMNA